MKKTDYAQKCGNQYETEHYVFHYRSGSYAEKDIKSIAALQEDCYKKITFALGILPSFCINYYLLDTPEEVGEVYGDNEPCNGFADAPNNIFAVYNQKVKCVGMHEDTHIISYIMGRPQYAFVREGLAMYMDEKWWGCPNKDWVKEFLDDGSYVSIELLLEDKVFFSYSDAITYPIAGAFTEFMICLLKINSYLEQIYYSDLPIKIALKTATGNSVTALNSAFIQWIQHS